MNSENTKVGLQEAGDNMLKVLDPRSKDIIVRRFGLRGDKKETLESIGKEYGITRERVRQIEANAKKALASLRDLYAPAQDLLEEIFKSYGGVLSEEHIIDLVQKPTGNSVHKHLVRFYLEIIPAFSYTASEKLFQPHWRLRKNVFSEVDQIVEQAVDIMNKHGHPVSTASLIRHIQLGLSKDQPVAEQLIIAVLTASRQVAVTAFGDWGLISWAETSPRGVGDKAYAVLRRHGNPAHFRSITDLINEANFDYKRANAQTVHNELIKDRRFVLVGRGLYGLKEWGFMTGTVADVLETILAKSPAPLSREELIDQVLKQRLVKKNTILLSLQNSRRFRKVDEDRYTLRQTQ